ncbi:chorismate mutase [Salinactinospora qingdaonensis]|uniref:Chorismate mutase domain-containing protein n=1 Tax=Salinactinospora qingdaonensis TaxID=702744 RepID=A0ABP7ERP4_9ACTN
MAEEPVAVSDLEKLRERMSQIDERLLDTLRERIECGVEIAHHKRENNIPMMQPHRIGVAQQRAAEYGQRHGINTDFLRQLYDLVISETCRVEDVVIGRSE